MENQHYFYGSLHNHTDYSNLRLRDCIIKTTELINYAIELGHQVVAVTDHDSVSNSVEVEKYYSKIKEKNPNFKVIRGNEIYLCRNGLNKDNFNPKTDRYYHFILLAKDAIGHQQIREISTRAWKRSYMARGMRRVPTYYQDLFDIIKANRGHVIGSTACLGGALPTQLLKYRETGDRNLLEKIYIWIKQMNEVFGDGNFFFELQPSKNKDQIYVNEFLLKLSKTLNIPYIITTDSHYLRKSDRKIHKAYLNAQNGDREVDDFYATTYLMNTEELESFFPYFEKTDLQIAYSNIKKITDMCEDFSLSKPLKIPQLGWKKLGSYTIDQKKWAACIPYLNIFWDSSYVGDQQLADTICLAMEKDERLQYQECYDEINECLRMTWVSSEKNNVHWSAYFLNLQKIIEECWNAGTLVGCGRGSGVGFILLYLLEITQINPLWETTKTFNWRFLNPDRVSVLDVDVDIEGGRRTQVLEHLRKIYGEDRVANVATFGTEKAKSAILTACRGLGIDVDIAQYLSSMVASDRGIQRSLTQTFYGDEENGFSPNKQFVYEMTENYPEVWEVAQKIEGLVCRLGIHAGGVIFVDEPFTNSTSLMRAPDGTIITAFELHNAEDCSLIKYDLLSVEALDKMHICLDLLEEQGYISNTGTLKEKYEKTIGIYNLEREDKKMWQKIWNHEIQSLFQMEQQSGIQGIALTHPESVDDLAILNSVIRLMAQEKGAEQPLNKFARFKNDINLWYNEMDEYGLTEAEQKILEPIVKISYGISESQEKFMQLVQTPECGGFDLTWADRLRKSIAKKNPAEYDSLTKEYFEKVKEKGLSKRLCNYVWNVLVATSRGYGFNASHTLAYSLIALQEMNLAFKYPTIFWNCACLISDSGGGEKDEEVESEELNCGEDIWCNCFDESVEDFEEETEDEDDEEEELPTKSAATKKPKAKVTAYGKIATAIGKMKKMGVKIVPPDINNSTYTFSPDIKNNAIKSGLSGITRIGESLIQDILKHRPYTGVEDFLEKVKINKPQMVNLIKSGAFDSFGEREKIMSKYIDGISDQKKRVTLQNMKMLIDFDLVPQELAFEKKVYNFNKYIRKSKDSESYYLDAIAERFFENNYDIDLLQIVEDNPNFTFKINKKVWEKIYQKEMDKVRLWIKKDSAKILEEMNRILFKEKWEKYCSGNLSKWEMDSISYYSHKHELEDINNHFYGFSNFFNLPEEPEVARVFEIKDKETGKKKKIPLFEIRRIVGTVLDKDKTKNTVSLLTPNGVVTVKIYGQVFSYYDKQLSEKGEDGKKHVIEKSWLSRGNKIIVSGISQGDHFLAKKYNKTPWHLVELIEKINEDGTIEVKQERSEVENN
jgi:DNA polymerase-3 subunit alpha